tara:strand:+ start:10876 stop:11427 length:552 start_codon:yes stop_codon:yes gene_type:complete
MNKSECELQDWKNYAIEAFNEEDGITYKNLQFKANKQCSRHEVAIDHISLKSGYDKSILRYCTTLQAWNVGEKGRTYLHQLCDPAASELLISYFRQGYTNYRYNHFLEQISQAREKLIQLKLERTQLENNSIHRNSTEQEIAKIESLKQIAINHMNDLKDKVMSYELFSKTQIGYHESASSIK